MTQLDARTIAADQTSRDFLATAGLDYRRVDAEKRAELDGAFRAVARGFLGDEPSAELLAAESAELAANRVIGVYDPSAPQSEVPVGTVESWVTPLTVPGGELPMWAISGVTVAATHRRRGIARAMLEGELRAAAEAGVAMAGLTVSEATIYGRYGFGPATFGARWSVDTRRAGWRGPHPSGSVQYLDREPLAEALSELHERTRASRPGDIAGWPRRWRQIAGSGLGERHDPATVRGVRYVDADGALRGAMCYRIIESDTDWARSTLEIRHLVAETAEARAGLWRFALQHDLVGSVTAGMRPADDALPWLLADPRAAVPTVQDEGWLRIIDLPRALAARRYGAPLSVALRVEDTLGFADGLWRLDISDEGGCRVEALPEAAQRAGAGRIDADAARAAGSGGAADAGGAAGSGGAADVGDAGGAAGPGTEGLPVVELDVAALSSLYLGGVTAASLAEAGRVRGAAATLAALDAALRTERTPHLSIEY